MPASAFAPHSNRHPEKMSITVVAAVAVRPLFSPSATNQVNNGAQWPAIAVSQQHSGPSDERWEARNYDFSAVCEFVPQLLPLITEHRLPRRVLLNVNAPAVPAARPATARVTRLGRRIYYDKLIVDGTDGPRTRYSIYGEPPGHHAAPGTDFAAIDDGAISVSPLHFELTDEQGLEPLRALMNDLGIGGTTA